MRIPAEAENTAVTAAELVHRIGEGDRHAEEILVRQYRRPLLEMLRHRSRDYDLAQDLCQDTLTIIIKRLRGDGLEDPDKLVAFMHRTAHNVLIGNIRKEVRRDTHPDTDTVEIQPDTRAGQLELLLAEEEGQCVRDLLHELPTPRDREVLSRYYISQQEKPDICEAMGLNAQQFDRVISRARQRYKTLYENVVGAHR